MVPKLCPYITLPCPPTDQGSLKFLLSRKPDTEHTTAGHTLDPGLLIIHVSEELVQAVGLAQLCSSGGCHVLDLLEATIDGVPFLFHLGGVEGTAGHQTVGLAVQVLQTILGQGDKRGLRNLLPKTSLKTAPINSLLGCAAS